MMSFYKRWVVPPITHFSMRNKRLRPYRERVSGAAQGRVLDVGIGSGLNLPLYPPQVREIFGLDPSPWLLARARKNAQHTPPPVQLLEASAERIPLADRSMDTVVLTWTACSIPDVATALDEMRRVLKPGGRHLNRKIDDLLVDAGFRIDRLETGYIPGPRIMSFLFEGAATPR